MFHIFFSAKSATPAGTTYFVILGSCFHLYSVVSVAEFCKTEAANVIQGVDPLQQLGMMAFGAEFEHSTAEQVELHRHFSRHRRVDDRRQLMSREDA